MTPQPPPSSMLTSLLNSLHSHLQAQTQLLPTLHAQLGLPPNALEEDLRNLEKQLRLSVDSQIDARRQEVDRWMEKCEEVENECARYSKALGGNAKATGTSLGELRKEQMLPKRYELVAKFQESLRQMYHTKLEQLTTITNRLNALSRTLDVEYFALDALEPTMAAGENPEDINAHRDVTPERFLKLEKELVRGKGEMSKRLNQLSTIFIQIDWLHTELGMTPPSLDDQPPSSPTIPSSTLHSKPRSSSRHLSPDPFTATPTPATGRGRQPTMFRLNEEPALDSEEQYLRTFARYVAKLEELEDDTIPENPNSATPYGLEGVEPSPGLLRWAEGQQAMLEETKRRREAHIQGMYDQLEALWKRMGVDESAMDAFVDMHKGSTEQTIQEYEEELERMLELKRGRMGAFIESAREEIVKLWDEVMIGRGEREDFAPFADDEHTEELLSIHEEEIRRLKEERRLKAPILTNIKRYYDILAEEKELLAAASDQTRLLGRGSRDAGRLLREEKMRKRVQKEKPRLERELLTCLPAWEQEHGQPFLINGEHFLQSLTETVAMAEQETNKRRSTRAGSAPPRSMTPSITPVPSAQPSGYIPGKTGVVTPAIRPAPATQMPPSKRQKLSDSTPSSSSGHRMTTRARGATPVGARRNQSQKPGPRVPLSTSKTGNGRSQSLTSPSKSRGMNAGPRQVSIPTPKPGTGQHILGHGRLPAAATQGYAISGCASGNTGRNPGGAGSLTSSTSTMASTSTFNFSHPSSVLKTLTSSMMSTKPAASTSRPRLGKMAVPQVVVVDTTAAGAELAKKASRARRESFRPRPSADGPYDPPRGTGARELQSGSKFLGVVMKEEVD